MNENFGKSARNRMFIELEVFNDESIERFKNKIANLKMQNKLDAAMPTLIKTLITITKLYQPFCRM